VASNVTEQLPHVYDSLASSTLSSASFAAKERGIYEEESRKINDDRLTNSAQSLDPKHVDTLVFHRYGDQHFLYQVWPAGGTNGRELVKSRNERELRRKTLYEVVQVGN
jgi:hypothetical protein